MSTEISRRKFLIGAGAAAASLPLSRMASALGEGKRPNIVFILTDDQRFDSMSCMGHPFAFTPNLDRLAREGARFANGFVTTSLCSPSRASFLTGRYASSHGVINNSTKFNPEIPTFGTLLQNAGYDTAFIGKWHMATEGNPQPGWNRWISFKDQGLYWNPTLNIDGEKLASNGYVTDLLTNYAVEWLTQDRTSPFCLCLWHKAVHAEFAPAVRHTKLYSDVIPEPPPSMYESDEGKPSWLKSLRKTWDDPDTRTEQIEKIRNYYRTLAAVDDSVGKVLKTLEQIGVLDDTLVVFAGDNGHFLGEHGLGDKRAMYEESIRIPLLMRYPRMLQAGSVIDPMVLNIDLCPTFLNLAGVRKPEAVQGESLTPLFHGPRARLREDWLYEYNWEAEAKRRPGIRGVRTERWKYTTYLDEENCPELYDLKNDPLEMKNIANDAANARVLADMKHRLERWLDRCGRPGFGGQDWLSTW